MAAASESESTAAKLAKTQSFAEDLCQETSQHAEHVLRLTEGLDHAETAVRQLQAERDKLKILNESLDASRQQKE